MNKGYIDTPDVVDQFYEEAARCLKGKKSNSKKNNYYTYEVTCPNCNKIGSTYLYNHSTNPLQFRLKCFRKKCGLSLYLNQYILRYWSKSDRDRWIRAVYPSPPIKYDNQWKGIKNRVPYEERKPKEKTFREKMTLKSIRLMTNVRAGKYLDPDSYFWVTVGAGGEKIPDGLSTEKQIEYNKFLQDKVIKRRTDRKNKKY